MKAAGCPFRRLVLATVLLWAVLAVWGFALIKEPGVLSQPKAEARQQDGGSKPCGEPADSQS